MTLSLERPRPASAAVQQPGFVPIKVLELGLESPLPDLDLGLAECGIPYQMAKILVRLHSQPLGTFQLPLVEGRLDAPALAAAIEERFGVAVRRHLDADGLDMPDSLPMTGLAPTGTPACERRRHDLLTGAPLVSVVVCTRNRTEFLARALTALTAIDYPRYEVIIVDNAPSSDATEALVRAAMHQHSMLRYVREALPGLARARNCGFQNACGEIVVFTDDDVTIDRHWLSGLVEGFAGRPEVGCVTGLLLPSEIETPAQAIFEQAGGFSTSYVRREYTFDSTWHGDPLYPYRPGMLGTGANMAFRREALAAIGGFDPALGAGSQAWGGEELAAFFQILTAGYTLVAEPAGIVWHTHCRDDADLADRAYGYGVGFTAFLTKCLLDEPRLAADLAWKLLRTSGPLLRAFLNRDLGSLKTKQAAEAGSGYPPALARLELKGMLYGPIAYLKSRRATGRVRAVAPPATLPAQ